MIFQEVADGGLLAFRQTDHALLSGSFAAAWGNGLFPALVHRSSTLVAAARHDDGWSEWELAPSLHADGSPMDFIRIPVPEHTALYRRGIDLVEIEDAFAGLVVSMHGERLYTHPFEPGMDPRISRLEGHDLELAEQYVALEHQRQAILAESAIESLGGPLVTGDLAADAEECWRLLQVWDRLSLVVCMQALDERNTRTLPPVATKDGDVRIEVCGANGNAMILDPYPFGRDPQSFAIEAFELGRREWPDGATYREELRTAPRRLISFEARSA